MDLVIDLLHTCMDCKGMFLSCCQALIFNYCRSVCHLTNPEARRTGTSRSLSLPQSDVSHPFDASDPSVLTELLTPLSQDSPMRIPEQALNASQCDKPHAGNPLDAPAREFGIDAHVVQANTVLHQCAE